VTSPEGLQGYAKISGKFPTNLHKHLEKSHSEAFKELEAKEQEKKQRESQSERSCLVVGLQTLTVLVVRVFQ